MKKFITFCAIVLALGAGINSTALAQVKMTATSGKLIDTVTNTGSKTWTGVKVGGPMQNVTVSSLFTAITGTFKGIAYLYGSPDNVTYYRIRSTSLQGSMVDSLLIDAAHPKYTWIVNGSPFPYYQILGVGLGTVTFSGKGQYIAH